MNANELYKKAYGLHYDESNYVEALKIYSQIINDYPESQEAGYSKAQIGNISKLQESGIDIAEVAKQSNQEKVSPAKLVKQQTERSIAESACSIFSTLSVIGGIIAGIGFLTNTLIFPGITAIVSGLMAGVVFGFMAKALEYLRELINNKQ